MSEPNTLLDALIDEAGMSRAGLAERINRAGVELGAATSFDHRSVGRWIGKGQIPRGQTPELICAILSAGLGRSITLDDIGMRRDAAREAASIPLSAFVERAPSLWRSDDQAREEIRDATLVTGLPAIAPVWEWSSPPDDIDVSRNGQVRVGADEVRMLRVVRSHYEDMYRKAGGVAVRPRVVTYLNSTVTPLLRGSYGHETGRDLYRAVGGLVAVAGICAYDSDRQGLAQRYFHQALRMAKASGDRGFGAYVVALLVNQSLHLLDYRQAVAFAEAGLRGAGPALTPALATDFHSMQAKAFARMNDRGNAHDYMRKTEAAVERIRRTEEPPETGYVQPGLVETQFAEALYSLGDVRAAQRFAEQAVEVSTHARGRVNRLATVAKIALGAGEVDRTVDAANRMLDEATGMESHRLFLRFRQLRETMDPRRSGSLRDLVERLDTVLAIPLA